MFVSSMYTALFASIFTLAASQPTPDTTTAATTTAATVNTCGTNYCNSTAPFHLVVSSKNTTYDGTKLSACHVGAAIESLCLLPDAKGSIFGFNESSFPSPNAVKPGYITWNMPYNTNQTLSVPLTFSYDPASNIALPLFFPSTTNVVSFTFTNGTKAVPGGYLAVPDFEDDTTVPVTYTSTPTLLQRWYVCQSNYGGYNYSNLSWRLGKGKPENPSCVEVKVERVFI